MDNSKPDVHSEAPVPAEVQARVLREFVASSPAGFLMLDHQLRHIEVSPRWMVDWGVTRSFLLGKHHYDTHPDLPERIKEAHRRALAGEIVYTAEDRFIVNGKEVRCAWEVRPWGRPGGAIGGILIYAEDLTGGKRGVLRGPGQEDVITDTDIQRWRSTANLMSHSVSWLRDGRSAMQGLLSEYREIACTCEEGYYEKHRAHQVECRAHASVPLIGRAERAVRELSLLEDWLLQDWRPES